MNTIPSEPVAPLESIRLSAGAPPGRWRPVVGHEIKALLSRKKLSDADARGVEAETCRILSKCVGPNEHSIQQTGLVIGYVQSGKTLSFTAVTALARDNNYRMVIVLGGTTTHLVEQSHDRLITDLDIDDRGARIWSMFDNPGPRADTTEEINRALRSWTAYPDRPDRCQTVLIVAMKNHRHLVKLERLLESCDLAGVSALVVDDEGDQAGLNNKVRQDEESTTYRCLRMLRQVLPTHTYLLYTATPQAPLLISRIDMLSPEFADPIEPGEAYVGGRDLFSDNSPYIETIPTSELPDDGVPMGPPASLEKALMLFFVGVAVGCIGHASGNRSMMIHPSSKRDWHQKFVAWVRSARTSWLNLLRDSKNSPDRRGLLAEFRVAYDDLLRTAPVLPTFDKIAEELEYAIDQTQIKEVNARIGRIPTVQWKRNYSFILVGGTGLDRGFTVEGLTVTYMPRGAGMGNADTVQQRGRFFGYKRDYIGLVRIFLEQSVEASFRHYVEHENSIRKSLVDFRNAGKPLAGWRRAFFLDSSMSPTRRSVLSLEYMTGRAREWIYPKQPQLDGDVLLRNQAAVKRFEEGYSKRFVEDVGAANRTADQKHSVASGLPLRDVYRDLLVPVTAVGDDLLDYVHVLLQIERELEREKNALCDVYIMGKGRHRKRSLDKNGAIKALLQGANAATGYPGDRQIKDPDRTAIQIHTLDLESSAGRVKGGKGAIVARSVPCIAVGMPRRMRGDVVVEREDD